MERTQKKRWSKIERTAYHEAGHAVMAYLAKQRLKKVTIIPDNEGNEGMCTSSVLWMKKVQPDIDRSLKTRSKFEGYIMSTLGGVVAERLFTGRTDWPIPKYTDMNNAVDTAGYFTKSDDETSAFLKWLWERTKAELDIEPYSNAVHALALELVKEREVGGRKATAIIEGAIEESIYSSQPGQLG